MKVGFETIGAVAFCVAAFAGCSRDLAVGATSDGDAERICVPGGIVTAPIPCSDGGGVRGEILAGNQANPDYLAVDGTNVYWTNSGLDCDGGGSIMKVALEGGVPVLLAPEQDCPVGIAVDDAYVYWTNNVANGSVARVPIGGGRAVVLASGQFYPTGIAVNANDVVWANGENSRGSGGGIVAADAGSVMRAPLDGGAPVALVSGLDGPFAVAVDDTNAYFTAGGNSVVEKVSLAGDAPVVLATSGYGYTEGAIAIDGANVYTPFSSSYSDMGGCNPAKIALDGGTPISLVAPETGRCGVPIYSLATDGAFVYWTQAEGPADGGAVDLNADGVVKKVSVNGGVPITLASGLNLPRGVAVDDASVYWAAPFEGTVRRTAK